MLLLEPLLILTNYGHQRPCDQKLDTFLRICQKLKTELCFLRHSSMTYQGTFVGVVDTLSTGGDFDHATEFLSWALETHSTVKCELNRRNQTWHGEKWDVSLHLGLKFHSHAGQKMYIVKFLPKLFVSWYKTCVKQMHIFMDEKL